MQPAGPAPALKGDEPVAASPQGLLDRRALTFVAFERTRMPMVVTDPRQPDNPIVLANRAYVDLTGYSADELIGRNPRFMQGPETDAAELARVRDALAAEHDVVVEMLNYRKDGSTFWNQLFVSPVHDEEGKLLYHFASLLDVTRRRRAQALEAVERRLLKEVDHRAKNALAIVQGIVRLTRADDADGYAHAVQSRVDVLARAHGLLAEGHWRDVPLAGIVASEVAAQGASRIRFDGPNVLLSAGAVQPLALLLHELAMNACEHGALSGDGTVEIDWAITEGERRLVIGWRERGGLAPAADHVPGFGLAMMTSIAERQLGGRTSFAFTPEGLHATVTIAIAAREADERPDAA